MTAGLTECEPAPRTGTRSSTTFRHQHVQQRRYAPVGEHGHRVGHGKGHEIDRLHDQDAVLVALVDALDSGLERPGLARLRRGVPCVLAGVVVTRLRETAPCPSPSSSSGARGHVRSALLVPFLAIVRLAGEARADRAHRGPTVFSVVMDAASHLCRKGGGLVASGTQ